jgi:hypothetical protein
VVGEAIVVGGVGVEAAGACPVVWVGTAGGGKVGVLDAVAREGKGVVGWVGAISGEVLQAARSNKLIIM